MLNTVITVIGIIGTVGSMKPDNFIIKYIYNSYNNYKHSKEYENESNLKKTFQKRERSVSIEDSYEELSHSIISKQITNTEI